MQHDESVHIFEIVYLFHVSDQLSRIDYLLSCIFNALNPINLVNFV